jgi:N-acetylglucosamine kinase-like BadF-type ATPase
MSTADEARLGVDVGGTHTDAVIVGADDRLIYTIKDDTVVFVAIGPHDAAYRDATRRI